MNIYEINHQIQEAYEASVDPETGEIQEGALATIQNLDLLKADKIKAIGYIFKGSNDKITAIKKETERLKLLKKIEENKQESVKRLLDYVMKSEGITIMEFATLKVGYRKTPPRTVIDDINKVPSKFQTLFQEVRVDKVEFKKYLKENESEGGHLESENKIYIK